MLLFTDMLLFTTKRRDHHNWCFIVAVRAAKFASSLFLLADLPSTSRDRYGSLHTPFHYGYVGRRLVAGRDLDSGCVVYAKFFGLPKGGLAIFCFHGQPARQISQ